MISNPTSNVALSQLRHDLRTPINHIIGYSELLAEEVNDTSPAALTADLEKIRNAANNLLKMVGTHLSEEGFQRLTSGDPDKPATGSSDPETIPLPGVNDDGVESDAPSIEGTSTIAGTLLIVDDHPENCETLRRRLVKQGHAVAVAYDGESALQRMHAKNFDLVLLDILMPGIDGYEVLRRIKADELLRHVPVIMISALDEIESVVRCIEIGAEDYLPKPFNPTLLRARIGACLEKKALRDDERRHLEVIEETQQRLTHELDEAARYVRSIIPDPILEPVCIDWKYIPSTELGGDAFGYHWLDETHFAIYLLDVCGHGVGASLLSVTAMNVIRSGALADTNFLDPAQVLSSLNLAFPMERQNNMYFTIWYGVYDLGSHLLTHSSGGHPPALLLTPEGTMEELRSPGLLIGAMPDAPYRTQSTPVPPGSCLMVFSDGVYEIKCPNNLMVDFETFKEEVVANYRSPDGLDHLAQWAFETGASESLDDDYSMLRVWFQPLLDHGR